MDKEICSKIEEIIQGYNGDPELLWSYILTNFSVHECKINHKYDRNLVIKLARPRYYEYMTTNKDKYRLRYLVKKMDESTGPVNQTTLRNWILKHPNAAEIYKHERHVVLNSLYELMDEYPITCLILSGEFIKYGFIPNVYKEENRGKIKSMVDEFKNWYECK